MADGVVLNAGSGGSTAATDDCGASGHAQIVKLAISTDGSATPIPAEATNGLDVDVTRVIPGVTATALGKAEDAAAASADTGVPVLAVRRDTVAVGSDTDGDYSTLNVNSSGRLYVTATVDAALPAGTNAIGKLAANSGVDIGDVDITSIAAGDNNIGNVDIVTMPTVTVNAHAVTNAGTFAVQVDGAALTSLQLADDTVFADDAAFTLASSKVSMAGAVRDDALSTLTAVEGDAVPLRVSSTGALHVTGAGGGTQYNVDDVAGATDTGTLVLAIRDDSLATLTPADGDYVGLRVSSTGALHVTGGGGGTEYTVDAAAPAAPIGATFVMERDDALSALTEAEGDWTNPRASANGALWTAVDGSVAVTNAGITTIAGAVAGTEMQVDVLTLPNVTLAAGTNTNEVVGDAAHDAAAAGNPVLVGGYASAAAPSDVSADADVVRAWHLRNGAAATVLTAAGALIGGDATNGLDVDVTRLPALVAGTANIGDVDVLTIAAGDNNIGNVDIVSLPASTNTLEVVGDVAHDAAAAGNPVQTGGYATNSIEGVTQVAAGDLTRTVHDLNGVQVVRPHTTLEECLSERVTNTDGASTALTTFAAGGSGVHNYITQVTLWNSSATDGYVDLRDGTGGSVKWTVPAPQTGGCTISFSPPLKFADNTAVAFDASAAISTIYLSFNGFQAQG